MLTRELRRAGLALLWMMVVALAAWLLSPTRLLATEHGERRLEDMVPRAFAGWRMDEQQLSMVVNPQAEAMLKQVYAQTLSRTYVDAVGHRVMLSIAYGTDQRDGMQMHYPEVCYPAQGFQVLGRRDVELELSGRRLPARLVETELGTQRHEPLIYWTVIGERVVRNGVDKKIAELHYGLRGVVPDGMLVRISSIDRDDRAAFALQEQFATDLLLALTPQDRLRLVGP